MIDHSPGLYFIILFRASVGVQSIPATANKPDVHDTVPYPAPDAQQRHIQSGSIPPFAPKKFHIDRDRSDPTATAKSAEPVQYSSLHDPLIGGKALGRCKA